MKITKIILLSSLLISGTLWTNAEPLNFDLNFELNDSSSNNNPIILKEFPLDLVSPSSGVQFYKDGIIFLSNTKGHSKMSAKHLSFGLKDAYYAQLKDSTLDRPVIFSPAFPFSYPTEAVTFSADYKDMYYTKISPDDGKEKIYHAFFENSGRWTFDDDPLEFCKNNSVYTHPAVTSDNKVLVFASDIPGTKGGLDLFFTQKEGSGWTEPESMGTDINSNGTELFPLFDSKNNLFFSSDGLPGFGGFDIYSSIYNGKSWDTPLNLMKRINTEKDELAFTMNKTDGKTGFLSVKGNQFQGELKLYKINLSDKYQKSEMNLASLLLNLALLEKGSMPTDVLIPEKQPLTSKPEPDVKKEEVKPPVTEKQETKPAPVPVKTTAVEEKPAVKPESKPQKTEAKPEVKPQVVETKPAPKPEPVKVVEPVPEPKKDEVIYRVQIASTSSSKGSYTIKIAGKDYKTWEYYYKGAYRTCVGELKTLAEARAMQSKCRQSGYAQAFAVVFVNDERSLDPSLFK